jgi:predicted Rossmann fold nucleotide-binding protein DprA/Smf involved in DNA uptake
LDSAGNKNDMERKKGAHKLLNQMEKLIKNSDVKNIEKLRELEQSTKDYTSMVFDFEKH